MIPNIVVIDHYDSFTYNLVGLLELLGAHVHVFFHDKISLEEVRSISPSHILLSPGPGHPEKEEDTGISPLIIQSFRKTPILGICMGHEIIATVFGAKVKKAEEPMHGRSSLIYFSPHPLFKGIKKPFSAIRYHSLIVTPETVRLPLSVIAWSFSKNTSSLAPSQEIMGLSHQTQPLWSLQFHPESILSENGALILKNFLHQRCK